MTLRDYFAAQVLPSLVHNFANFSVLNQNVGLAEAASLLAERAYVFADALIAEREKE
jgi:hypothetical protein